MRYLTERTEYDLSPAYAKRRPWWRADKYYVRYSLDNQPSSLLPRSCCYLAAYVFGGGTVYRVGPSLRDGLRAAIVWLFR
jgi:hypothetical protein